MPNENQKNPNQNPGFDPKKQQRNRDIEKDDDDDDDLRQPQRDVEKEKQGDRGMNEGRQPQGGQNRPDDRK